MNLRIGICDDETIWQEKAVKILESYGEQQNLDLTVSCFGDGESLMAYSEKPFHVLFMDIELGNDNGIDFVHSINEKWPNCQIIYLTNYISYAMDVYRTKHIYFIIKDRFEERLGEVMDKIYHQLMQRKKKLIFSVHGCEKLSLRPKEILYFERDRRVTRIHTVSGEYITNEKIGDLMERLPAVDFVRCHNSYIVYLPAVETYSKGAFLLHNGKTILISRGYTAKTEKAFIRWAKTQML